MELCEIRFGNLVFDKDVDGNEYLTRVGIEQMEYPHNCRGVDLDDSKLTSLGFKKENEHTWYAPNFTDWYMNSRGFLPRFAHEGCSRSTLLITKCTTVHQLQNLYFALYGEELTINVQTPNK